LRNNVEAGSTAEKRNRFGYGGKVSVETEVGPGGGYRNLANGKKKIRGDGGGGKVERGGR